MNQGYKNAILEYLNMIEKCFDNIGKLSQDIDRTYNEFNHVIDYFVLIDKIRGVYNDDIDMDFARETEELGNLMVKAVELVNDNQQSSFLSLLASIQSSYRVWAVKLKKILKYKIVVYGITEVATVIDKVIDFQKADIVCYIDCSGKFIGQYINGKVICSLEDIKQIPVDYIFNLINSNESKQNLLINEEQYVDYTKFLNLILSSPEFYSKHYKFLSDEKNFDGIITGLSYAQKAIDTETLNYNFCNMANPAQDLFYDFEMFKYAYSFESIRKNIKYAIIGLSYYSFHYDLSLSVNQSRVNYYYPLTKKMHNSKFADTYIQFHKRLEEIEKKFLKKDHFQDYFIGMKDLYEQDIENGYKKEYNCQRRTHTEILSDIEAVKKDYDKNYTKTVEENKLILTEYLKFLHNNSIKPIIIVCPTTKLYQAFTPAKFRNEFYEIIDELSLENKFQFLDYYYSNEFDDSDFADVSHMNYIGARKFSEILNRDINFEDKFI